MSTIQSTQRETFIASLASNSPRPDIALTHLNLDMAGLETADSVADTRCFDRWLLTPASCRPRTEACNASGASLKQAGEWEREASISFLTNHPPPTSYSFVLYYQDPAEAEEHEEQVEPMINRALECSLGVPTLNADEVNEVNEGNGTASGSRVKAWIDSL